MVTIVIIISVKIVTIISLYFIINYVKFILVYSPEYLNNHVNIC